MRILSLIVFLCAENISFAEDFDSYCKKNIKGKYSQKKRKNICWCVDENLRSQLSSDDRIWLFQNNPSNGKKADRQQASVFMSEPAQKRIKDVEFQTFKNCTMNYKWKANADDLGVPDDITAP